MARAKKSSLDMDEPVVVQDEVFAEDPVIMPDIVVKAEEPAVVEEKKPEIKPVKAETETQNKPVEKKTKRGVKICVI